MTVSPHDEILSELRLIRLALAALAGRVATAVTLEKSMAKTQAEYVADLTALTTKLKEHVTAETTLIAGAKTAFEGQNAMLAALKEQIAELLKGQDPAVLAPVLDAITAVEETSRANQAALADAILIGTPQESLRQQQGQQQGQHSGPVTYGEKKN